jgi:hypothetical protein
VTEQEIVPHRRWFTRHLFIVPITAVVLLAGAGVAFVLTRDSSTKDPGLARLAKIDGSGAAACDYLSQWLKGKVLNPDTKKPYAFIVISVALSTEAAQSTTPAIKATVTEPVLDSQTLALLQANSTIDAQSYQLTNLTSLYQACDGAGVKMPPVKEMPN